MSEQNFEAIAQLIAQLDSKMEAKFEQIDARFEQMDAKFSAKFEQIDAKFEEMDAKLESFKGEIISEFNHSLGIQSDELSRQFKVAAEEHAALTERVERLEERVTDAATDEVLVYCAEKGIELPTGNTEAMIRLIQESRRDRAE